MRSVLLVRLGALGDVVHTMPVIAALRRSWPDARIDWLIEPRYVDVVRMVRGVNQAVLFDTRGLLGGGGRAQTLQTIGALRRQGYDVVLDFQGLVKSASVARLAGGTRTIGFAKSHLREPAARVFYSETVDVPAGLHIVRKNLALLAAVDISPAEPEFALDTPESSAVGAVTDRFGESGYLAINPGAAWPNKRWPADRFGRLAAAVFERHRVRSVVVWGPGEESLAQSVVTAASGSAEVAPPTTIPDLFGVLGGSKLTVAGDTGPLHIAVAMGTPVVGLFGPTDPARNGPWLADDVCVSRWPACECHYERTCRRSMGCLDDISVEEVLEAVERRLNRVSREARA